jgi:hypothetical protein
LAIIAAVLVAACSAKGSKLLPASASATSESFTDWITFHRQQDREWSRRTGLSVAQVRSLRQAAGIPDDQPFDSINSIDARTLPGQRVLFVTFSDNGHCLDVAVYRPTGSTFREVWSQSSAPDGSGFCRPSLCGNPRASATKKGEINIAVPVRVESAQLGACDRLRVLTYARFGRTYSRARDQTRDAQASFWTRDLALARLFGADPADSDRILTLQIRPAFSLPRAIAFDRKMNGLQLSSLSVGPEADSKLAFLTRKITAFDYLKEAQAVSVAKAPLALSADLAQTFLDELSQINLQVAACVTDSNGNCALLLDGTKYVLTTADGRTIELTDTGGLPGVKCENPALLSWILKLQTALKDSEQLTAK